jgi:hypothetical protein
MSDNTKKSIVINQSFLSGSGSNSGMGNYGSSGTQNKKSKKLRTKLTDESILKPNKLKRMLLDKINAKRKAEQTSPSVQNNNNSNINIDVSKESKIFSSEFKKSLEFLDNYVNTKQFDKNKNNSKTLKKQNAASLSNDIIKTLHNNNTSRPNTNIRPVSPLNSINNTVQTQRFIPQQHQQNHQQKTHITNNIRSTSPVSFSTHNSTNPSFQKIELQLPPKSPTAFQVSPSPSIINTPSKINLALGKPFGGENLIHTELPPELQPSTPSTMMFIPSSSSIAPTSVLSTSTVHVQEPMSVGLMNVVDTLPMGETGETGETGEMGEIEEMNNQKLETDSLLGKTSLATSTSTFSPIKLFDDKPYGCLKDGKKPTYRAYNRTIKNNLRFSDNRNNDNDDDNNDHSLETERQQKLRELKNKHRQKNDKNNDDNIVDNDHDNKKYKSSKLSIRRHFRKTITKKFKLGKQGNTVGVLIKNNETRKNIQKEHGILKNKKLSDVKKYLVEHNLIKIGSTAPPAIIRKIYEDSVLTGEVENIGKGVSLHNFLEEEKPW